MPLPKTLFMLAAGAVCANATSILDMTLGASAGFANGSTNARVGTWNAATSGNPAPFNGFTGNEATGPSFTALWTFTGYGALSIDPGASATLTFGIYDLGSSAAGNQVALFEECANATCTSSTVDLSAQLNTLAEGLRGGSGSLKNEYDILGLSIPSTTFADIASGSVSFQLTLQGPGLGVGTPPPFNGAGIDFSELSVTTATVPEPGTWVFLFGGLALLAGARLRRIPA